MNYFTLFVSVFLGVPLIVNYNCSLFKSRGLIIKSSGLIKYIHKHTLEKVVQFMAILCILHLHASSG